MDSQKICVVGLGYVGLPLAIALNKHYSVVGFDVNQTRINELQQGNDGSNEVSDNELQASSITFTTNPVEINTCNFIIVCVPTPIDKHKKPDLTYLESSSELIGKNLSSGSIVIYESTVYPGVTEEVCVPILEKYSGLKYRQDFKIGYSPERMNPGDKERSVDKIVKIVSGSDHEALDIVNQVYSKITRTHQASSIKVAEAAKVIENIRRDLNIALMNELAIIFDKMNIKTTDVLKAAGTKWNFHAYTPGLVGGHCIGVDPYYLTHKAMELGYHPEVILAGRRINDSMHKHVMDIIIRELNSAGKVLKNSKVVVMGLSFKENVKDYRNSKALDLIHGLQSYGIKVYGCDDLLGQEVIETKFKTNYVSLENLNHIENIDGIVMLSPHYIFHSSILNNLNVQNNPFFIDVKAKFNEHELSCYKYRSL
nr:nucleotide sugar dehydrogenase [Candidatus Woesearchaeota archaeon]